jgi:hypothetical protein
VIAEAMSEVQRPNLALNFVADPQSDIAMIPLSPDGGCRPRRRAAAPPLRRPPCLARLV